GPQGQLEKVPRLGGIYVYMRADHGSYFPSPTSELFPRPVEKPASHTNRSTTTKFNWDRDLPPLKEM
ncbi:hypothetical protein BDR22DRAFT_815978, partial [Usnea florida]